MRVAIQCMSKACCSGHISHSRNVQSRATGIEDKWHHVLRAVVGARPDLRTAPARLDTRTGTLNAACTGDVVTLIYTTYLLTARSSTLTPSLPVLSTHLCDVTLQSIERSGPLTRTPHHRPRFPRGLHASAKKSCQRSEDRTHQPFGFAAESLFD